MTGREVKGLIFDKDGTLFDFTKTWGAWAADLIALEAKGDAAVTTQLANALGYDVAAETFAADSPVIAEPVDVICACLAEALPHRDPDDLMAQMEALAQQTPQLEAVPLVPYLMQLAAADIALGVATNDSEAAARVHLQGAGVEHVFDFICGFDSGFGSKPGPGQLLTFASRMTLDPANCAMVGDSLHDIRAARAAGFQAIGVLTGPAGRAELEREADVVLGTIGDIPTWLAG